MSCDILIIGSGSVCENTCRALALMSPVALRVTVLGRSKPKVEIITALANAISGAIGTKVNFIADTINWDSEHDLPEKIAKYSPHLIFQTATLQTPWDFLETSKPTRWKQFLRSAGEAIIIPMQVLLSKRVATIAKTMSPLPIVVNACFPDYVNPILKYLDLPITSGIGNVAMVAGFVKARYPQPEHKVQIIAHIHHCFKIPEKTDTDIDGLRVWIDGQEVLDVEKNLADAFHDLRLVDAQGKISNELIGTNSALTLQALLGDTPVMTHVPGPNGLPGGYPVIIQNGKVELDLPDDCTEAEAIALNKQGAYDMGVSAINENGFSTFSTTISELLMDYVPHFAKGFHIDDLDQICQELIDLRSKLEQLS